MRQGRVGWEAFGAYDAKVLNTDEDEDSDEDSDDYSDEHVAFDVEDAY